MDDITRYLYKQIKEQADVDVTEVHQIIQFMFGEGKKEIESGSLRPVFYQYLGTWSAKPVRAKMLEVKKGLTPRVKNNS